MSKKLFLILAVTMSYCLHAGKSFPLDPLTIPELNAGFNTVLKDLGITSINTEAGDILDRNELNEPTKVAMKKFLAGGPRPPREAVITYYRAADDSYFKYIVALECKDKQLQGKILSKKRIIETFPARPSFTCTDNIVVETLVLQDPDFRAAMHKRGITDEQINEFVYLDIASDGRVDNCSDSITCNPLMPNLDAAPRPRVFVATAFWNDGNPATVSAYIQPIDGVAVYVDRRTNKVIKVVDTGEIFPISKNNINPERPARNTLKPLAVGMPEGPSYKICGNEISWENWKMRFGMHPRYGLVLYMISYLDKTIDPQRIKGVERSILYRANISEYLTTYGSPEFPGNARSFLDFSEYPAKIFIPPLIRGVDIPPYAQTFPFNSMLEDGSIFTVDDAFSIYEQDGGMLWRHVDYPCSFDATSNGRRGRQLVFTHTNVIANYDFAFYWIFNQDGRIDIQMKATGIVECTGTHRRKKAENIELGGNLLNKFVVGANHLHRFCARLDFDIDGSKNRVYEKNFELVPLSAENSCGNQWAEEETLLKTEKEAVRNINCQTSRSWVVENCSSKTKLGYSRGYEIALSAAPENLTNPCTRIGKRANFLHHSLFVTRTKDNEFDAMGEFPVEQPNDLGLTKYIADNEDIVDKDITVWVAGGFGHGPKTEQYPVMPFESYSFTLLPHFFFEENPALDVDKNKLVCIDGGSCCAPAAC